MGSFKRKLYIYALILWAISGLGIGLYIFTGERSVELLTTMLILVIVYLFLYFFIMDVLEPYSKGRFNVFKKGSKRLKANYLLILSMDVGIVLGFMIYISRKPNFLVLFLVMLASFLRHRLKNSFQEATTR